MRIAVSGATGFLGRYIVNHLCSLGHTCRCWFRGKTDRPVGSDRGGFDSASGGIEWIPGAMADEDSATRLVDGMDAMVHAALDRPGVGFRGAEGDLRSFYEVNVLGTVRLIEAARAAGVKRFVFISTCAVHERILDDRKLDEAHPMWPMTHYGAHKAAIEQIVYGYGLGQGYDICALRPTGIYGVARPLQNSKWFDIVQAVRRGDAISSDRGGKEVHAADVAKAVALLLTADGVAGQAYNCYDRFITQREVARIAKSITGSDSLIEPTDKTPKHQIDTTKLRELGMTFGGRPLLEATVREMIEGG